jgi:hypothetical protein
VNFPHLAKKPRDMGHPTPSLGKILRICFFSESRMRFTNATEIHGKYGGSGRICSFPAFRNKR